MKDKKQEKQEGIIETEPFYYYYGPKLLPCGCEIPPPKPEDDIPF